MRPWRTYITPRSHIFVSYLMRKHRMDISKYKGNMNVNTERIKFLNLWRGEFANSYISRPRLYKALTENEVSFEGDDEMLKVTFYVKYESQKDWIETVMFDDFVEKFLTVSGIKFMELRVVSEDDMPTA